MNETQITRQQEQILALLKDFVTDSKYSAEVVRDALAQIAERAEEHLQLIEDVIDAAATKKDDEVAA